MSSNKMSTVTVLAALEKFQEPLRHIDSADSITFLGDIGKKLNVSLSREQKKEIGKLEQPIKLALEKKEITKDNVHPILDLLTTINTDIQKAQRVLFKLTSDESYLNDKLKKQEVLYQLNIIHRRTQQLYLLTQQIQDAIENNKIPQGEIPTITNALFGTQYFKDQKSIPISISTWLADTFLPKLASIGQQCGATTNLEAQLERADNAQMAAQTKTDQQLAEQIARALAAEAKAEEEQKAALERESEQLAQQLAEQDKAAEKRRNADEQAGRKLAEQLAKQEEDRASEQLVQQLEKEEKAAEEKRKAAEQADRELAERLAQEQAQQEEVRKAAASKKTPPPPPPMSTTQSKKRLPKNLDLMKRYRGEEFHALFQQDNSESQTVKSKGPNRATGELSTENKLNKEIRTLPKWLNDAIKLSNKENGLRQEYQRSSAYAGKDNFEAKVSNFIQKKLAPSKTRNEQLKLMEDTLRLLETSDDTPEKKTKIARGLMLVIKHKTENEGNKFNSRMGIMVDKYINATDEIEPPLLAKDCIDAFQDFSSRLTITKKMKGDIQEAKDASPWQQTKTAFYQLHQNIDAIKKAISVVPVDKLTDAQVAELAKPPAKNETSFRKIYNELQQGFKRDDVVLTELVVKVYKEQYVEVPYGSFEAMVKEAIENIGKERAELKTIEDPALLYVKLMRIGMMVEDYDYLIKIAELQFSDRNDPSSIKVLAEFLNRLAKPLEELRIECKNATAPLRPAIPNKIPSNNLTPAFEGAKNRNQIKATAREHISRHIQMMKIEPTNTQHSALSKFQSVDNTNLRADRIAEAHKNMLSTPKTTNIPVKELLKRISNIMDPVLPSQPPCIFDNIMDLEKLLNNKKPDQKKIYTCLMTIETQLQTLVSLAKIAELKLGPTANLSDKDASALQAAFPKAFSDKLEKFKELRQEAHEKLGIPPKPGSKLQA